MIEVFNEAPYWYNLNLISYQNLATLFTQNWLRLVYIHNFLPFGGQDDNSFERTEKITTP